MERNFISKIIDVDSFSYGMKKELSRIEKKYDYVGIENITQNDLLKISNLDWMNRRLTEEFIQPIAITLNMKHLEHGKHKEEEFFSEELLYEYFERFIHKLSKKMFKNAYKRFNKRVQEMSYIEGNSDIKKRHIHSIIDLENNDLDMLKKHLNESWRCEENSKAGSVYISISDDQDGIADFASYISKDRTKFQSVQDALVMVDLASNMEKH